jgi:hypothetical protein
LVEKQGTTLFTEGELANAMKKSIDQVKPLFVDLLAAGLLISDPQQKKIQVSPKLLAYAAAVQGSGDYDNILVVSDLRKVQDPIYASISLDKQELIFRQVEQITLSEAQQVRIFPDTSVVYMYQNRDIGFSGTLQAGKCEIQTQFSKFDYENFQVNLLTTERTAFRVRPLRKEDGQESILLLNVINGLRGTLRIDKPDNKAGKPNESTQYPILSSIAPAHIYYSDLSILKGAYDSTRFYYQLNAFELDSLDNFAENALKLEGNLISAGIFPKIPEPFLIQKLLSLSKFGSLNFLGPIFLLLMSKRYSIDFFLSFYALKAFLVLTLSFLVKASIHGPPILNLLWSHKLKWLFPERILWAKHWSSSINHITLFLSPFCVHKVLELLRCWFS